VLQVVAADVALDPAYPYSRASLRSIHHACVMSPGGTRDQEVDAGGKVEDVVVVVVVTGTPVT